jgi:peroxin-1
MFQTVQSVIVELQYRSLFSWPGPQSNAGPVQRSSYFGWTGLPSKRKLVPIVGKDGLGGGWSGSAVKEHEISTVEVDTVFGRTLGLTEGQKVRES